MREWMIVGCVGLGVVALVGLTQLANYLHPLGQQRRESARTSSTPTDTTSKKQHLERARLLIQNGHGSEALDDLGPIVPTDPEYAEAQKLKPKASLLREKELKEASARAEKFQAQTRRDYATEMETKMLEQYHDFYVRTAGQNDTTLRIQYVLMSRPFVYNLMNGDFPSRLKAMGFKKVILTDGYNETWNQNL